MRTLNSQDDRLEQIEKEISQLAKERDRCRQKTNDLLAKLELEAEV